MKNKIEKILNEYVHSTGFGIDGATDDLLALFNQEVLKIIGEDEKCQHAAHIEPCNNITILSRNYLRKLQRQKV